MLGIIFVSNVRCELSVVGCILIFLPTISYGFRNYGVAPLLKLMVPKGGLGAFITIYQKF
jgi:hypothetical protein